MRIVAFSGDSNSGKTTLIEKLITHLKPHKTVAAIKHDPKDKAIIDTTGKDSDRFFKSGADIAIFGTTQTTLRFHHSFEISKIIQCFANYDYLFIEGLKEIPFSRISIARETLNKELFAFSNALAIDESIKERDCIPKNIHILNLNNPLEILQWIDTSTKDIKE